MANFNKSHPDGPHAFIQWKGTNVCADLYCECGASGHVDDDFMYFWECPKCRVVYEVGWFVQLAKADPKSLKEVSPTCIKKSKDYFMIDWELVRKGDTFGEL